MRHLNGRIKILYKNFQKLDAERKAECVIAAIFTLFLLMGIPVYAWFSYSKQMETLTKIKAPTSLDIRAGNKDAIENLELKNIDIEDIKKNGNPKRYVFCVRTGNINATYDIQLAHTTNIPFTYTLYRAREVKEGTSGIDVDYTPLAYPDQHTYYKKEDELTLTMLNPDTGNISQYGRTLALKGEDGGYYSQTYDVADGTPEIYAIPVYSRVSDIRTLDEDYDFFILELGWDDTANGTNFDKWNKADNNKETDMIYISASLHTQ